VRLDVIECAPERSSARPVVTSTRNNRLEEKGRRPRTASSLVGQHFATAAKAGARRGNSLSSRNQIGHRAHWYPRSPFSDGDEIRVPSRSAWPTPSCAPWLRQPSRYHHP